MAASVDFVSSTAQTCLRWHGGRHGAENKKAAVRFSPTAASKGGRGKLDLRKLEAPKT